MHLSPRPRALAELAARTRAEGPEAAHMLMCELALYFLIYTGNVRLGEAEGSDLEARSYCFSLLVALHHHHLPLHLPLPPGPQNSLPSHTPLNQPLRLEWAICPSPFFFLEPPAEAANLRQRPLPSPLQTMAPRCSRSKPPPLPSLPLQRQPACGTAPLP